MRQDGSRRHDRRELYPRVAEMNSSRLHIEAIRRLRIPPRVVPPLRRVLAALNHLRAKIMHHHLRGRRLFLGPGFRLAACWNRLGETVKTRKKRGKTGKKWARYGLKRVKEGS